MLRLSEYRPSKTLPRRLHVVSVSDKEEKLTSDVASNSWILNARQSANQIAESRGMRVPSWPRGTKSISRKKKMKDKKKEKYKVRKDKVETVGKDEDDEDEEGEEDDMEGRGTEFLGIRPLPISVTGTKDKNRSNERISVSVYIDSENPWDENLQKHLVENSMDPMVKEMGDKLAAASGFRNRLEGLRDQLRAQWRGNPEDFPWDSENTEEKMPEFFGRGRDGLGDRVVSFDDGRIVLRLEDRVDEMDEEGEEDMDFSFERGVEGNTGGRTERGKWREGEREEERVEGRERDSETTMRRKFSKGKQSSNYSLNRKLVEAVNLGTVLEIIACEMEAQTFANVRMSPVNVATALHRLAFHMEREKIPVNTRLSIVRRSPVEKLVWTAMGVLDNSRAQGLANMTWALGKLGGSARYKEEMDLLANALLENSDSLSPQHIANATGAMAISQHSSLELFKVLGEKSGGMVESFQPKELSQLMWASAVLVSPSISLLDAIDNQNRNPDSTFFANWSTRELVNVAWAYGVLGEVHRTAFKKLWLQISEFSARILMESEAETESEQLFSERHLSQLYQVVLTLELEFPRLGLTLEDDLRTTCYDTWRKEVERSKNSSDLEKMVAYHLATTGHTWEVEYSVAEYSIDFALPGKKVALEVDGPSHYTRNGGSPLGSTILKRRHLEAAGWAVVSIPYYEWAELYGEMEQRTYLQQLLAPFSNTVNSY